MYNVNFKTFEHIRFKMIALKLYTYLYEIDQYVVPSNNIMCIFASVLNIFSLYNGFSIKRFVFILII